MTRLTIQPASKADVLALYPDGLPYNGKVISICLGMQVVGICGVLHGEDYQAFSRMTDEIRNYPVAIWRAGLALVDLIKQYDAPVIAVASPDELNSDAFLTRLGFVLCGNYKGKGLYQWPIQ